MTPSLRAATFLVVNLTPYLFDTGILVLQPGVGRDEVLRAAAEAAAGAVTGADAATLLSALIQRESQSPTGTPEGVAFPHAMVGGLSASKVVVIRLETPIDFGPGRPCDLVFAMFGDTARPWEHVRLLARLARITGRESARASLRAATSATELHEIVKEEDDANA